MNPNDAILIDPSKSRVVLIGCSTYDDASWSPIPKVTKNIEDLATLFRDKTGIGFEKDHVKEVLDKSNRDEVIGVLKSAAREAADTLIVYYAGHGALGYHKPDLLLTVKTTPYEEPDHLAISLSGRLPANRAQKPSQ